MKGPSAECADVAPGGGQREVNHDWLEANTVWSERLCLKLLQARLMQNCTVVSVLPHEK